MTRTLTILLALVLSACASTPTQERSLQIACISYDSTFDVLTTRYELGLVTDEAQERIDAAVAIIAPVCESETPVNAGSVLDTVESALIVMIQEQEATDGR